MNHYVFDIDGVLADPTHRLHHIQSDPKDWDRFFAYEEIMGDAPREREVLLLRALFRARQGITLITGRSEQARKATERWLRDHRIPFDALYMRRKGDHRPDHIVKPELVRLYLSMHPNRSVENMVVFEDRLSVVEAYREAGILVLQNARGDF